MGPSVWRPRWSLCTRSVGSRVGLAHAPRAEELSPGGVALGVVGVALTGGAMKLGGSLSLLWLAYSVSARALCRGRLLGLRCRCALSPKGVAIDQVPSPAMPTSLQVLRSGPSSSRQRSTGAGLSPLRRWVRASTRLFVVSRGTWRTSTLRCGIVSGDGGIGPRAAVLSALIRGSCPPGGVVLACSFPHSLAVFATQGPFFKGSIAPAAYPMRRVLGMLPAGSWLAGLFQACAIL